MKTLFLCSIGPVQDFIASARRSRDLWYGSWLLSELSKAIAKYISDTYGFNSLVFPYPKNKDDLEPEKSFNVPNKIVAILDKFSGDAGKDIKNAMYERLENLWGNAESQINGPLDDSMLAKSQVMDLPEFYWAAVPFESTNDYQIARTKGEAILAARKNTRDFAQIIGANKPKSSLDGIRESVIPETSYPKKGDSDKEKVKKIHDLYLNFHARQAEQLSGVDLLKRLGPCPDKPEFPSTSDLAASPFFFGINNNDSTNKTEESMIKEIKGILKKYDWKEADISEKRSLVFESRLGEYLPIKEDRLHARRELSNILEKYAGKRKPNPYYALLIADGDNMGKVIDTKTSPEDHRMLSRDISRFAVGVATLIKKYEGTCIYAGGEDILAYLPLHKVLACVKELQSKFRSMMLSHTFKGEDGSQKQPTLSGAIVIAHHLTPLSDVFNSARNAEKEAKQIKGKNGITIVLNKRSGAKRMIKDKWPDIVKRLAEMIELNRKGWISSGTAYELQQLHHDLSGIGIENEESAITAEALRIIKRKRQSGSDKKLTDKVICQFTEWLTSDKLSVNQLALEMIISKEFAGAEELAQLQITEVL